MKEYERLDTMAYDEQRAKLREFGIAVILQKRDHDPRVAIDLAFVLSAWDRVD